MTYFYASLAGDAEILVIFYERPISHHRHIARSQREIGAVDSQPIGKILNVALATCRTCGTIERMVHEDEFHDFFSHDPQAGGVGLNSHPLRGHGITGSHGSINVLDLNYAETAGIRRTDLWVIAEGRDPDTGGGGRIQDG